MIDRKKEDFIFTTSNFLNPLPLHLVQLRVRSSRKTRFNRFSRNEFEVIVRAMGNEESHDLSSNRSAKFVCERNARSHRRSLHPPPFLRTRDHRIGKSSSAVSCNYHPTDKGVRVRFWRIHTLYTLTQSSCVGKSSSVIFPPSSTPGSNPNLALFVALACVPGWLRADRISVRVHRGLNDIALFRIERQPVSLLV